MFISRCSAKELRKKNCIKGLYYACEHHFCQSLVSYLLPSLVNAEQCRQPMTFMVFEGMHILAKCLSTFFRDYLYPFWVSFTFFAYIKYMDYCWKEQWILFMSCLPHLERNLSETDSTQPPCRQSNGCQGSVYVWQYSFEPAKWACRVGTGNCLDTCDY